MSFCRSRDAFATVAFPPARGTGTQVAELGNGPRLVRALAGGLPLQTFCKRFAAGCKRFAADEYANPTKRGRSGSRDPQRFRGVWPLFAGVRGIF